LITYFYLRDDFSTYEKHNQNKWWVFAEKLEQEKKPVSAMRADELDALSWYEACWLDSWQLSGETPQTWKEYEMEVDTEILFLECQQEIINRKLKTLREILQKKSG
jgi:hypothetical protein